MNDKSSTTNQWLRKATAQLESAGIATARLDCLVLLEDALGKDRSWILAHPGEHFDALTSERLNARLERRLKHEPLAYIRGKTEFYGREFTVSAHTLEPRPETEDMIDLLKEAWRPGLSIIDVGTGSGAIGITAALEVAAKHVELVDIDKPALKIARQNLAKYRLKLKCYYSDVLGACSDDYDVILANLPYVPDSHTINRAAMQEPRHAIFGGPDGLDLYRRLFAQVRERPGKPQFVLTECLPFQHETLASIAAEAGYRQKKVEGFVQLFEVF